MADIRTPLSRPLIVVLLVVAVCLLSYDIMRSDPDVLRNTWIIANRNNRPQSRVGSTANKQTHREESTEKNQRNELHTRVYKSHPGCEANVTLRDFPVGEIRKHSTLGDWPMFQSEYKNPCWFYKTNDLNGVRCLPYVYELGVSKSGTTSLYNQLVKHPDIVAPNVKEGRLHAPQFLQYIDDFSVASEQIFRREDDQGFHNKITIDANPSFFTSSHYNTPKDSKLIEGPKCTLAHVIYAINPRTRFIVIMRNPTDRLFANHHHFYPPQTRDQLISSEYFHKHVLSAIEDLKECVGRKSLRACAFDEKLNGRFLDIKIPLFSSLYFPFAKEWLSVFPRDQVLFLKAEEFYEDAVPVVQQVFDFLGLRTPSQSILHSVGDEMSRWYQRELEAEKGNTTYRSKLLPETRVILDEFYAVYNEQMSELLGHEKWLFKRK